MLSHLTGGYKIRDCPESQEKLGFGILKFDVEIVRLWETFDVGLNGFLMMGDMVTSLWGPGSGYNGLKNGCHWLISLNTGPPLVRTIWER